MKKHLVEAIGTFFLVLTIPLAITYAADLAPIAIWWVLMVMIYAWGHISGAHFNPAVSLAIWIRGKITLRGMFWYRLAQFVGAILAAITASYLLWGMLTPSALWASGGQIILAEFLFTFALARVILHVSTDDDTAGNSFYGLAIWCTVLAGAYAIGSISGWSFNPAVTIWWSIAGVFSRSLLRLHLIGQLVWAFCAAQFYLVVK